MSQVWELSSCKIQTDHIGHSGYINTVTISPDGSLCAATASSIIIFDLEKKSKVDELKPEYVDQGKKSREPECVSLAWSADGQTLFAGYTDNKIRAWGVMSRG